MRIWGLIITFIISTSILVFLSTQCADGEIGWEDEERISWTIDKDAQAPDVVSISNVIHFVYHISPSAGDDFVGYKRSIDSGDNWEYQQLSDHGRNPRISGSLNFVHVVYTSDIGTGLLYSRSSNYGVDWDEEVDMGVQGMSTNMHSVSSHGPDVYVTYTGPDGDLYLLRSYDNGESWYPPIEIGDHVDDMYFPEVDATGKYVHVTYLLLGNLNTYYLRSTDHGNSSSWDSPLVLIYDGIKPSIASFGNDVIVLSKKTDSLVAKVSSDFGSSWSSELTISNNISVDVNVVWSPHDIVHVVWRGSSQGDGRDRLYHSSSHDNGTSFSPEQEIVNTSVNGYCMSPVVAFGRSRVHVLWEDDRNLGDNAGGGRTYGWELYYRRSFDIIAPNAPQITSNTHPQGAWTSNGDPDFTWTEPADDSGIDGYSVALDGDEGTVPEAEVNINVTTTRFSGVEDGVWYLHVRARDGRGNWGPPAHYQVLIDTVGPDGPVITSSSHPESSWVSNNSPTLEWSEPVDDSGIGGYSYSMDTSPDINPDETIMTTLNTASISDLDDRVWYFHLRAVDQAGNWGNTSEYIIMIDTTSPDAPVISSLTHPEGTWISNGDPYFEWSTPLDASGIAGYSIILDDHPSTVPPKANTSHGNSIGFTSVGDGIRILHVRARDNVGNWGPTAHYITRIDTMPPDTPLISSSSHPEDDWVLSGDLLFNWTEPSDLSGLAGYSILLDVIPTNSPDANIDTTIQTKVYSSITHGIWFFNVVAIDRAGNIGLPDRYRVMVGQPPEVIDLWLSRPEVNRTEQVIVYSKGNDDEALSSLVCDIQFRSPSGDWLSLEVTFELGIWSSVFSPGIDADPGHYSFRVMFTDNHGLDSTWFISEETVLVRNNPPLVQSIGYIQTDRNDYLISVYCFDVEDEFLNLSCEVQYRVSKQNWVGINSVFQTDHWEVLLHVDASSSKITYDIRVIVTDSENTSSGWQERDDLIAIDNEERDNILQLSTFSRNLIFILVWFFVLLSGVVCYLWRLERQKQYRKSNDIYAYFIIILIFGIFVSQHMSANTLNIWTLLSAVIYSMVVGVAFYDFFRDRKVIIMPSERAEDGSRRKISEYEYTVSVACAKEKKEYVEKVASLLADKGIRILFGPNKARAMWGYDIISFNDSLMREKTFVYIPFISSDFIRNRILMMELESALARQVEQDVAFILPVRFDDTNVPGIPQTKASLYVDEYTMQELVDEIILKVREMQFRA